MQSIAMSTHATTSASSSINLALESVDTTLLTMAFSLRLLLSSWGGPLVTLRRSTDNAVQDFYPLFNGKIDAAAVTTWLNGATATISVWHNQTGLPNSNAFSSLLNEQPGIDLSGNMAAIYNGNNRLTCGLSVTDATNAGNNGTLLTVVSSANTNSGSFGAWTSAGRWSSHMNWSDGNCYFDTGPCCQAPRAFTNSSQTVLSQYTFVRSATAQESRKRGVSKVSGLVSGVASVNSGFGIGHTVDSGLPSHTGNIAEMVLFKTDLTAGQLTLIETEQISYWGV